MEKLFALPVRERIARAKYIPEDNLAEMDDIEKEIKEQIAEFSGEGGDADA